MPVSQSANNLRAEDVPCHQRNIANRGPNGPHEGISSVIARICDLTEPSKQSKHCSTQHVTLTNGLTTQPKRRSSKNWLRASNIDELASSSLQALQALGLRSGNVCRADSCSMLQHQARNIRSTLSRNTATSGVLNFYRISSGSNHCITCHNQHVVAAGLSGSTSVDACT